MVNYPLELDLRHEDYDIIDPEYIDKDQSTIYDLFAVTLHFGGTSGGHLTACTKNSLDGHWYYVCDMAKDCKVARVTEDIKYVKAKEAVVVLYRRRQIKN